MPNADLHLRSDGSELVEYDRPGFPVRTKKSTLGIFFDYAAACHWHRDFEALLMLEGEMDYFVNGEIIHLLPGEAVFVNSGRLHYGFSPEKKDCLYQLAVFHPDVLGESAPIVQAVDRLCADESPDCFHLRGQSDVERRALLLIADCLTLSESERALSLLAACLELTECICALLDESAMHATYDESWALLRRMTGYIQKNYEGKIRLEDIAAAAAVCRSRCCRLFKEKLGCTPGEYTTSYRLNKACGLIAQGCGITEAALSCGFNGASYFAETFRKVYSISPREYRERYLTRADYR